MDLSPIYRYLAQTYGNVTKQLLLSVVAGALRQSSLDQNPFPPTRSQKRAKAGLIAWMDKNTPLILNYLESQTLIH
jgi:hypothetical protein